MAGIGTDIKEVLEELGVLAIIVRSPTNLTEMIAYEIDNSASRSFYREYALNVEFVYDTVIVAGDVLQFIGNSYMVAHKTADSFENTVTEYTGVVYKSNFPSTALLLVPTQTQDPVTFIITQGWTIRKSAPFGLAYRSDFFTLLDQETSLGRDLGIRLECIIPASYGAQILDRIYLDSTEFYRIQDIEKYKFPGLYVLTLVDDERPAYVP